MDNSYYPYTNPAPAGALNQNVKTVDLSFIFGMVASVFLLGNEIYNMINCIKYLNYSFGAVKAYYIVNLIVAVISVLAVIGGAVILVLKKSQNAITVVIPFALYVLIQFVTLIFNIFVFKGFTFRNFFTIIIFLILPAAAGITSLMFFIKKITPMKIAAMACVGVLLLAIIIQDIVITVRSHYYWDILFMFVAIITYGSIIASIAVTGSVPDVKPAPQQYYPPQGYAPQQGYMQQPNYAQPQQDYSNYNSFNQQ